MSLFINDVYKPQQYYYFKDSDYYCIISLISKIEAINSNEKKEKLEIKKMNFYLKVYLKMEKTIIKYGDIEISPT